MLNDALRAWRKFRPGVTQSQEINKVNIRLASCMDRPLKARKTLSAKARTDLFSTPGKVTAEIVGMFFRSEIGISIIAHQTLAKAMRHTTSPMTILDLWAQLHYETAPRAISHSLRILSAKERERIYGFFSDLVISIANDVRLPPEAE